MQADICLQCNGTPTGPFNRLVRDSCGHKKCRVCLLEDEDQCKLCSKEQLTNEASKTTDQSGLVSNGDKDNETLMNNYTAVIQLNGNAYPTANVNGLNAPASKLYGSLDNISSAEKGSDEIEKYTLKTENKNIAPTKIRKPDKDKRPYNSIDVPKHITVTSDPLTYHCDICNKSFVTKTHIKYHSYCTGAPKPFKCEICNKEFILRAQLDVHSYKHKSNKPYSCSICKKCFSVQSKLTRHSAVHSVVKSHICSVCGNAYRSKESLKIHSIIHRGEKPFGCRLCSAKFSNQSNLSKHVMVHSKEKAHMCDQCGKRFKLKWALTVHRRSHLRTRPHNCMICFKSFVNDKDLRRHSNVHADTKPYMCSICSISFRRQDNLRRHIKNTHPGKKGEVIKNVVLPPSENACSSTTIKTPIDNPNAIKVITTASPAFTSSKAEGQTVSPSPFVKSDCRASEETSVINGPIKLASKTPAFKSNYNINRDFDHVSNTQCQSKYDMAESVDICHKILTTTTSSSISQRNIICKAEPTSQEICQKILDPNSTRPLHYETSFQNKKHAMIKNIKFKVPIQYTSNFRENLKEKNIESKSNHAELKPVAVTSVIVNNNIVNSSDSSQSTNMHWRRRTSQNLGLKY